MIKQIVRHWCAQTYTIAEAQFLNQTVAKANIPTNRMLWKHPACHFACTVLLEQSSITKWHWLPRMFRGQLRAELPIWLLHRTLQQSIVMVLLLLYHVWASYFLKFYQSYMHRLLDKPCMQSPNEVAKPWGQSRCWFLDCRHACHPFPALSNIDWLPIWVQGSAEEDKLQLLWAASSHDALRVWEQVYFAMMASAFPSWSQSSKMKKIDSKTRCVNQFQMLHASYNLVLPPFLFLWCIYRSCELMEHRFAWKLDASLLCSTVCSQTFLEASWLFEIQ